jgi:aspartate aminotransferase-like enzyme
MRKYRLVTPRPTEVPEQALLGLARQVRHRRTDQSRALLAEVVEAIELVLAEFGQSDNLGKGVSAASRVLAGAGR